MAVRPSLTYDCPNCPAEHQGFNYVAGYDHPARGAGSTQQTEFIIFECNRCHYPVVVEILRLVNESAGSKPLDLTADYKHPQRHWQVVSIRPQRAASGKAPQHTPANIANYYEQGCRALQRGDMDVAGMGLRKALDAATRHLIRALNPTDLDAKLAMKLKPRINWLHSQGALTKPLHDWAHLMRDEGNEAAHEEEPYDEKQAEDLRDLTEVFLMYVFTIPGKIAERHPEIAEPAPEQWPKEPTG